MSRIYRYSTTEITS